MNTKKNIDLLGDFRRSYETPEVLLLCVSDKDILTESEGTSVTKEVWSPWV